MRIDRGTPSSRSWDITVRAPAIRALIRRRSALTSPIRNVDAINYLLGQAGYCDNSLRVLPPLDLERSIQTGRSPCHRLDRDTRSLRKPPCHLAAGSFPAALSCGRGGTASPSALTFGHAGHTVLARQVDREGLPRTKDRGSPAAGPSFVCPDRHGSDRPTPNASNHGTVVADGLTCARLGPNQILKGWAHAVILDRRVREERSGDPA